ncbi:MAG: TlpA family protein disulfide reductase [Wenzhouxiangella sp.]
MTIRCVSALLLLCLFAATARAGEPIEVELPSLNGETVRLSDFRGDWVVLNYWATWCAPCREEIPDFSRMHEAHDDITVLGLAFEDTDPEDFVRFLEQYPASYPILLVDTFDPPESLGAPRALPTTFLVNREGVKVNTWLGHITSDLIIEFIEDYGR